jgi:hypothetical protein
MNIKEFLESVPKEDRQRWEDILSNKVYCTLGLTSTTVEDNLKPSVWFSRKWREGAFR